MQKGAPPPLLLDVRARSEWEQRRIDGSVCLPLSRLAQDAGTLPADQEIVVHCSSGYRSAIAASLLRLVGTARVADLVGGLGGWEAADLPTAPD